MPVILETPVSASSAQEVYRTEKQKVVLSQTSPNGYLCSMPVSVVGGKVDFTDIPSGSTIETILKPNQRPVTFKVKDGVKVSVIDPLRVHAKITVKTESGDRFRAKDYAYFTNTNFKNINGAYEFNDPDFHEPDLKTSFKIDEETFERSAPVPPERNIYCRHLSIAALKLRLQKPINAWSRACEVYFSKEALPEVFSNIKAFEDICVDVHAASEFYYLAFKNQFGAALHNMCGNLSKHTQPGKSLEVKFYMVLNGPDISIPGHSCALVLKCESDKDNKPTFKIKLYDPNFTYNHMTFATEDLSKIKTLQFEDMFDLHEGYREFDSFALFELNKDWSEGVPQLAATWRDSKVIHRHEYSDQADNFVMCQASHLKKHIELWGFTKVDEDELPYGD